MSRNTVRQHLPARKRKADESSHRTTRNRSRNTSSSALRRRGQIGSPAQVLTREMRRARIAGVVGLVKAFIRVHKPVPRPDPVVRFETAPGVQECRPISWCSGDGSWPCWPSWPPLGCSRASFVTSDRWERRHRRRSPGPGVRVLRWRPARVQFDDTKSVIITRDATASGSIALPGLDLANAYGSPRWHASVSARPRARSSRSISYLRTASTCRCARG